MNKKEFNKILHACSRRRKGYGNRLFLSGYLVHTLTLETRRAMIDYIARYRGPILQDLFCENIDMDNLAARGYLYTKTSPKTGYRFLCTAEHDPI